jgi:iron(III) transport system substrate-binding protein
MKERGAPIDWIALGPVPAIMVGAGIATGAPHPNAAKLFLEFVLSREGQKLMQTPGRHIARGDLANEQTAMLKDLKIVPVNPALAEKLDEYARQMRTIFGG